MAQPLEYEQVCYNGPDGGQFGRTSTDLISFYGATPVSRSAATGDLVASTYTTTTNTTAVFGFNSAGAASSMIHNLSTLISQLQRIGLIT